MTHTMKEKIMDLRVIRMMPLVALLLAASASCVWAEEVKKEEAPAQETAAQKSYKDYVDEFNVEVSPISYAFVSGDAAKFRADNWRREGYNGGLEKFTMRGEQGEWKYEGEGHAITRESDYEGNFLIEKGNQGYLKFDYEEFRKYYENTGGVYRQFNSLTAPKLARDLALDIGKFGFEIGITPEEMPHLTIGYEHEYKRGEKSRLTWAEAMEGTVTRNIVPTWQRINEDVDKFEMKEEYEIKGYELEGEQTWEWVQSKNMRFEQDYSATTSATADRLVRAQHQKPKAFIFTNTLKAGKWFAEDKAYTSAGYHLIHLKNEEKETIAEMTESLAPFSNGANSENKPGNFAKNKLNQHTINWNLMFTPVNALNVITRLKTESVTKAGWSDYNVDNTVAPDGIINRTETSLNHDSTKKMGESIGLRYKGIPKTSLYTDAELQQIQDDLTEERRSLKAQSGGSGGEHYNRETWDHNYRGTWTAGMNFWPWNFVNLGNQFRIRRDNNDYDHVIESTPGNTAIFDEMDVQDLDFITRLGLKPCQWFHTSLRYMVRDRDYFTRENGSSEVKVGSTSDHLTFDVTLIPHPKVYMVTSFTRSTSSIVNSVSASAAAFQQPTFNSDVNTWTFDLNYHATEKVSVFSDLYYAYAGNYNEIVQSVSYGAAYDRVGIVTGLKYQFTEDMAVDAGYEYQNYAPDSGYSSADYHAHIIGLRASVSFA